MLTYLYIGVLTYLYIFMLNYLYSDVLNYLHIRVLTTCIFIRLLPVHLCVDLPVH